MKTFIGTVISAKMQNTVTVMIERMWKHPLYEKRVKRSKKYLVHALEAIKEGTVVRIGESKPLSKRKRWTVLGVVKK